LKRGHLPRLLAGLLLLLLVVARILFFGLFLVLMPPSAPLHPRFLLLSQLLLLLLLLELLLLNQKHIVQVQLCFCLTQAHGGRILKHFPGRSFIPQTVAELGGPHCAQSDKRGQRRVHCSPAQEFTQRQHR
jgi:hypothetical protein